MTEGRDRAEPARVALPDLRPLWWTLPPAAADADAAADASPETAEDDPETEEVIESVRARARWYGGEEESSSTDGDRCSRQSIVVTVEVYPI
mmetsp:Transcript_14476/g.27603  ORF Transcript_14476/g.27603 Transcript_14476/m.27603 type:complete len:92 (-) Transcript_14476:26-301(-)